MPRALIAIGAASVEPSRMPRLSTAEATVETLLRHGIDTVYALPGLHNDPLFDAFYHAAPNRLRVIHPRHEQTAAYMALGAALATGKPQVFAVVPGPGLLNAGAALLTAYGMNAPVIGLIGQIPQADIDTRPRPSARDPRPARPDAPHHQMGRAHPQPAGGAGPGLAGDLAGDLGPAAAGGAGMRARHLGQARRSHAARQAVARCRPRSIDDEAITAAAKILGAAERPIIVVGGGALDASAEVITLAEMLEAPVSSYRRGRGVVPSSHRLAVDMPIGHRLWKDADAVLAIGTRFFIQNGKLGHRRQAEGRAARHRSRRARPLAQARRRAGRRCRAAAARADRRAAQAQSASATRAPRS